MSVQGADAPALRHGNLTGIVAMLASMAFFVANDTCVKLAGETLPLGEIIFLRNLAATFYILTFAALFGGLTLPREAPWRLLNLRMAVEAFSTLTLRAPALPERWQAPDDQLQAGAGRQVAAQPGAVHAPAIAHHPKALSLSARERLKDLCKQVAARLQLMAIPALLEQVGGQCDRDLVGESHPSQGATDQQVEVRRLVQHLITPAQALLANQHRHQHASRRIRATRYVIEPPGKALLGKLLGDVIEKDVLPSVRIVELFLVALAQQRLDLTEEIKLATLGAGSEPIPRCSVGC